MATFVLDTSTLSGQTLNYVETPLQEKGYSITLEWVQAGSNQDIRIIGHAVRAWAGEVMSVEFPDQITGGTTIPSLYGLGLYGVGLYGFGGSGGGSGAQFILDTSVLGGANSVNMIQSSLQERGRSIQIEWVQAGSGQDIKIIGHAVRAVPAESHAMEPS